MKFQNKKKKKSGRNGSDLARRIIDVVIRYVVSIFPQAIPFLGDGKFVMAVVDAVRDGRREQLVENLLEVILPICVTVLQHIKDATLEKFKRADHTDHILRELQNRFAAAKLFCVTTTHPTMEEKKKSNEEEGKADAAEKAQQGQERNRFLGLFSNKIQRHELNPGDHIYSWRYNYLYAHHGIYVGDEMVIHFTRSADHEIGTGTVLDRIIFSSSPTNSKFSEAPCPRCGDEPRVSGVISSCLECFLHGGELYKFQYGVSPAVFLAKVRGGTCTLAASDPAEHVIHRAEFLLQNGFGGYDLFKNNCEDFAIYCKTDLLVFTSVSLGRSGQAASFVAAATAIGSSPLRFMTTSFPGLGAVGCGIYCISRLVSDIGIRRDVKKIPVEKLIARSGLDESNAETGVPNSGASEKLKDD